MRASLTGKTRSINWMFSKCSRGFMQSVIRKKGDCLTPRSAAFCGNSVVDAGEQCDCGTLYTCAVHDKCCTPRQLTPDAIASDACKLKKTSACSPRVRRCCAADCNVAKAGTLCRQKTDCTSESKCDGTSASCPAPSHLHDGQPCAQGKGACRAGMCSVSACTAASLQPCLCRRPLNHACSLCCRCGDYGPCLPAQWLNLASKSQPELLLVPGSHCLGGKCNNDSRCVAT